MKRSLLCSTVISSLVTLSFFASSSAVAQDYENILSVGAGSTANMDATYNDSTSLTIEAGASLVAVQSYNDSDGNAVRTFNKGVIMSSLSDLLVNGGSISDASIDYGTDSSLYEIDMRGGNDLFINSGSLEGQVNLGDGDDRDTFQLTGEPTELSATAIVSGGENGFDTLEFGGTKSFFVEQAEFDKFIEFEHLLATGGEWRVNGNVVIDSMQVSGGYLDLNGEENIVAVTEVDGGILNVDGILTSKVYTKTLDDGTIGYLNGNGTVIGNVFNGGSVSPATHGTIGTLTIDGNFTAQEGSELQLDVDPLRGLGDQLIVTGNMSVNPGANLNINFLSEVPEDSVYVMYLTQVAGDTVGTFDLSGDLADGVSLFQDTDAGRLVLTIGQEIDPAVLETYDEETTALVEVFINDPVIKDQLVEEGIPVLLFELAGKEELAPLSTELYGALYFTQAQFGNSAADLTIDRIDDRELCGTLEGEGQSNCRKNPDGSNVWGQIDASFGTYDTGETMSADYSEFRLLAGYDTTINRAIIGGAAGFGRTEAVADDFGGTTTNYAYFGGYASQQIYVANIDAAVGYTRGWGEVQRKIDSVSATPINQQFNSDSRSSSINANLRLTQEFQNELGWEIQPVVGAQYNWSAFDKMSETPQGDYSALGFTVDEYTHDQLGLYGGFHIRRAFGSDASVVIPEVRAKINHVVHGSELEMPATMNLSETSTISKTVTLPQTAVTLGTGLNVETYNGLIFFTDYDFTYSGQSMDHSLQAGMRITF